MADIHEQKKPDVDKLKAAGFTHEEAVNLSGTGMLDLLPWLAKYGPSFFAGLQQLLPFLDKFNPPAHMRVLPEQPPVHAPAPQPVHARALPEQPAPMPANPPAHTSVAPK